MTDLQFTILAGAFLSLGLILLWLHTYVMLMRSWKREDALIEATGILVEQANDALDLLETHIEQWHPDWIGEDGEIIDAEAN